MAYTETDRLADAYLDSIALDLRLRRAPAEPAWSREAPRPKTYRIPPPPGMSEEDWAAQAAGVVGDYRPIEERRKG